MNSTLNPDNEPIDSGDGRPEGDKVGPSNSSDSGSDTRGAKRRPFDIDSELDAHALERGEAAGTDRASIGERASADGDAGLVDNEVIEPDLTDRLDDDDDEQTPDETSPTGTHRSRRKRMQGRHLNRLRQAREPAKWQERNERAYCGAATNRTCRIMTTCCCPTTNGYQLSRRPRPVARRPVRRSTLARRAARSVRAILKSIVRTSVAVPTMPIGIPPAAMRRPGYGTNPGVAASRRACTANPGARVPTFATRMSGRAERAMATTAIGMANRARSWRAVPCTLRSALRATSARRRACRAAHSRAEGLHALRRADSRGCLRAAGLYAFNLDVSVSVWEACVRLEGGVLECWMKHEIEDLAASCVWVRDRRQPGAGAARCLAEAASQPAAQPVSPDPAAHPVRRDRPLPRRAPPLRRLHRGCLLRSPLMRRLNGAGSSSMVRQHQASPLSAAHCRRARPVGRGHASARAGCRASSG